MKIISQKLAPLAVKNHSDRMTKIQNSKDDEEEEEKRQHNGNSKSTKFQDTKLFPYVLSIMHRTW